MLAAAADEIGLEFGIRSLKLGPVGEHEAVIGLAGMTGEARHHQLLLQRRSAQRREFALCGAERCGGLSGLRQQPHTQQRG